MLSAHLRGSDWRREMEEDEAAAEAAEAQEAQEEAAAAEVAERRPHRASIDEMIGDGDDFWTLTPDKGAPAAAEPEEPLE